jgi:hypothetical protein
MPLVNIVNHLQFLIVVFDIYLPLRIGLQNEDTTFEKKVKYTNRGFPNTMTNLRNIHSCQH